MATRFPSGALCTQLMRKMSKGASLYSRRRKTARTCSSRTRCSTDVVRSLRQDARHATSHCQSCRSTRTSRPLGVQIRPKLCECQSAVQCSCERKGQLTRPALRIIRLREALKSPLDLTAAAHVPKTRRSLDAVVQRLLAVRRNGQRDQCECMRGRRVYVRGMRLA